MYKRNIPTFALQYTGDAAMTRTTPQAGDYNELSVVTEEFLDSTFRSVFEDLLVRHDVTRVFLLLGDDEPFTVDFKVSLDFLLPSEVPTVGFLIDRIREAFERDSSSASYLFDLNAMSETNPFSGTTSFSLIDRSAAAAADVNNEPGQSPKDVTTETTTKNYIMISLMVVIGFFVLAAAAFLWVRSRRDKHRTTEAQIDIGSGIHQRSSNDEYNADAETMRYLNTIRKRYRDEEDVRTAFDDVTLPERDRRESPSVPNGSTSQGGDVINYDERGALSMDQHTPGLSNIDTTLLESDLARSRSMESVSNVGDDNEAKDFDYLGLELSNTSFEEEDLRSLN